MLAFLLQEPGADVVGRSLRSGGSISSVNWAEVLSWFTLQGEDPAQVRASLRDRGLVGDLLEIVPFTEQDGVGTASLRPATRALGLSLGDRACLALARRLGQPVLTADRAWEALDVGLTIHVIR